MSHIFERYLRKHGHYPHVVVRNGAQRLTVEFAPGYVRISTSSPVAGEVYITANAARALWRRRDRIRWLLLAQDRSVDVPKKMHRYHLQEMEHLDAQRAEKRERKAARAKKARYEAAKRRART